MHIKALESAIDVLVMHQFLYKHARDSNLHPIFARCCFFFFKRSLLLEREEGKEHTHTQENGTYLRSHDNPCIKYNHLDTLSSLCNMEKCGKLVLIRMEIYCFCTMNRCAITNTHTKHISCVRTEHTLSILAKNIIIFNGFRYLLLF